MGNRRKSLLAAIFSSTLLIYTPLLKAEENKNVIQNKKVKIFIYTEYSGDFYVNDKFYRHVDTPDLVGKCRFTISNLVPGNYYLSQRSDDNQIISCNVELKEVENAFVKFSEDQVSPDIQYNTSWWGRTTFEQKLGLVTLPLLIGFVILLATSNKGSPD